MDNQFSQNDWQENENQQNGSYRQLTPDQQGIHYQAGNGYQPGSPYQQQGNPYQPGNFYQQQGNPYQSGNAYMGHGGANYGNYGGLEPEKAPNIFQQFVLAFVPTKYNLLTKVKTGSMIGFVTLLALIATVISFISFALEITSIDMEEVAAGLPDFELKNGRLHLDEDFLYEEEGLLIYLTDEIDSFSYDDAAKIASEGYYNIILAGRDRLSVMQNREYQQLDFKDFGNSLEISRTWIVTQLIPLLLIFCAIGYVFFFVGRVFWYFFCAVIYMLIGMAIAAIMRKQIETGELFRTAVYSKVLFFVIATVISLLPFVDFSIPLWTRIVATTAFMAFAIAKLPGGRLNTAPPMPMGGQGWQ